MKNIIIGLFSFFAAISVYAADSSSGCGMGWEVAPKQSLVSSFTRFLVNTTFLNSVAMTLGTSGCAKHSIVLNEKKGIHFAEANKNVLAIEMARGGGEFVSGFASIFGCENPKAFGSMVQSNYEALLPSEKTSGVELYNNVKTQIRNNASLSASCSMI